MFLSPSRYKWLFLSAVCLAGCSSNLADQPELGQVTGKVTMDGAPLANAMVVFAPVSGRSSSGVTGADGKYELQYLHKVRGAQVGSHKVQITTYYPDEDSPAAQKAKEKIPAQFNTKSTLTAMVDFGTNEIDFELTSK